MAQETDVIRDKMEDTRASLGKKIEALENTVVGSVKEVAETATDTVSEVTEAVSGTVETVTEAVSDATSAVQSALDIPEHVRQHPWITLGGAFVVGFIGARLLHPSRHREERLSRRERRSETQYQQASQTSEGNGDGWLHSLGSGFEEMIQDVKNLAIGTTMAFARDLLTQSASEGMQPHIAGLVDRFTSHLGAQPIEGPVVSSSDEEEQDGEDHDSDNSMSTQAPRGQQSRGQHKRRGKKQGSRR